MSAIAIVGNSGEGKSTSIGKNDELGIEGLDPKETVIINVADKDLPFRGWKKRYDNTKKISEGGNLVATSSADVIAATIKVVVEKRPEIRTIIIDDAQFIMAFEFMRRATEVGYGKFADLGVNLGKVIAAAKDAGDKVKVIFLWHPEKSETGIPKMKTVGKMVDDYLTLEGLFTVILYTKISKPDKEGKGANYFFVTNNDGRLPAKSPHGMFKDLYIPNDLGKVVKAIDEYNHGE